MFKPELLYKTLERLRGQSIMIEIQKSDGTLKEISGVVCKGKSGFLLNLSDSVEEKPVWRGINLAHVNKIFLNGKWIESDLELELFEFGIGIEQPITQTIPTTATKPESKFKRILEILRK